MSDTALLLSDTLLPAFSCRVASVSAFAMARPKKYATDQEREDAIRAQKREYFRRYGMWFASLPWTSC